MGRNKESYGPFTASTVGIVLKEGVRRAIKAVRRQLLTFETKAKLGKTGAMDDLVTTADLAAQEIYVRMAKECFPGVGIIAEENNLKTKSIYPGYFLTFDGVDGTKALARKQSHGIGTMVAMVINKKIVSAYVGDVMTEEIFGYRPESDKVHRIYDYELSEELTMQYGSPANKNILLRNKPARLSLLAYCIVEQFKDIEIMNGSIGTMMARLWKGEVGAVILNPSIETPWDQCPITGITEKLGYRFYEIHCEAPILRPANMTPSRKNIERNRELLVISPSMIEHWLPGLAG